MCVTYKIYGIKHHVKTTALRPYTGEPVFGLVVGMPEPSVDTDMLIVHTPSLCTLNPDIFISPPSPDPKYKE